MLPSLAALAGISPGEVARNCLPVGGAEAGHEVLELGVFFWTELVPPSVGDRVGQMQHPMNESGKISDGSSFRKFEGSSNQPLSIPVLFESSQSNWQRHSVITPSLAPERISSKQTLKHAKSVCLSCARWLPVLLSSLADFLRVRNFTDGNCAAKKDMTIWLL
jgi:hypothetical protein